MVQIVLSKSSGLLPKMKSRQRASENSSALDALGDERGM